MKNKFIRFICILLTLSMVFSLSVLFAGCKKELTEGEKLWEMRYQPIYGPHGALASFLVVKKSCVAKNGNVSESKTFYDIDGVLEDRGIRYGDNMSYGNWDNLYFAGGADILGMRNLYGTRAKIVADKLKLIDSANNYAFSILGYEIINEHEKEDRVIRINLEKNAYRTLLKDVYLIEEYREIENSLTGEVFDIYSVPMLVFHFKKQLWFMESPGENVNPGSNDYFVEFFFIMYANQFPEDVKPISFVPHGNY